MLRGSDARRQWCTGFGRLRAGGAVAGRSEALDYTISAASDGDVATCEDAGLPLTLGESYFFDGGYGGLVKIAERYRCKLCEAGCLGGIACVEVPPPEDGGVDAADR